jgi:hypothetical protein
MSSSPVIRLQQHAANKSWWPDVDTYRIGWYTTREFAADAELKAIRTENPLYNIAGRNGVPYERERVR